MSSIRLLDALVGVTAISLVAFLWHRLGKASSHLPYPPGPKGRPLVGNTFDMSPTIPPQQLYAKWGREFSSDIIHLKLLNTHIVVVNSFKIATELFDKRSALYSDRPIMTMLHELIQINWFSSLMRYGDTWRAHRRVMHKYFHPKYLTDFEKQQLKFVHHALKDLVQSSQDFFGHIRLMMGSTMMSITYGVEPKSVDHPWVTLAEKTITIAAIGGAPGAFLVDTFPMLKYVPDWMPGAGFKATAKAWNKITTATVEEPFQFVKDLLKHEDVPSVMASALRDMDERKDNRAEEEVIKGVAAVAYAAGADTTIALVNTVILGLLLYPETQKKGYEEIVRVIGNSKLPEFGDLKSLPYINAIVKEALRWKPGVPLAIPHRLMQDDIYDGMFLPAGSTVIGNVWAMSLDERIWDQARKFYPDRFLTPEGELDPKVTNPEDLAFGFGRRLCPGRHLAMSSAVMFTACLVASLEVNPIMDDSGQPILPNPDDEGSEGLLSSPAPFKCSFDPRSQQHLDLINEAVLSYA